MADNKKDDNKKPGKRRTDNKEDRSKRADNRKADGKKQDAKKSNKKKNVKRQMVAFFLSWLMFVGFSFAAAQSAVTSVVNELETGVIDIDLKEYRLDKNGKEVAWEDQIDLVPGATISKIPKITNKSMDCFVRAKVKITSKGKKTPSTEQIKGESASTKEQRKETLTTNQQEVETSSTEQKKEESTLTEQPKVDSLSIEQIHGISDDWIKRGEYFYYKKILKSKETVTLFQSIEIPSKWQNEHEQEEITITVQVDAVQAKNFTPNFSKEAPWGGLVIEKCIHENGYELNTFRKEKESSLIVHYEENANQFITKPDDFFAQFGTLMPGDEQEGRVEIKNKGKNSVNIFFKTEGLEEAELLEKTKLTIKNRASDSEEERIVYEGNLRSKELKNYILLGCYEPSYEGEFTFLLKLPEELNNEYSLEKRKVKWYFMAEEMVDPSMTTTATTTTTTTTSTTTVTSKTTVTSTTKPSKTTFSKNTPDLEGNISRQSYSTASKTQNHIVYPSTSQTSNPYKNAGENGSVFSKIFPKTGDKSKVEFFSICAILSWLGVVTTGKNLKNKKD